MTEQHFTAWLTTDTSCLDQGCADVVVLTDKATTYRVDDEGDETPVWESTGPQVFSAVTTVDAQDGDANEAIREAEQLLEGAGWRMSGEWKAVPTGSTITVERA